ncbi:MAG: enoyl-CoA hydratase/isomerase family protein [Planctomycetota bacterium]|nr:enoyl-CoA hydratase/isomerase family protein [Planctomycetota bacterium]
MPETPPSVRLTTTEQVATVVLDAPARGNALDAAMLERLEALLLGLDPDVRVVLVRGAGERAFSTGYHVPSLLDELEQGPSVSDFDGHPLERALRALETVPVPTVALVRGNAYGAGPRVFGLRPAPGDRHDAAVHAAGQAGRPLQRPACALLSDPGQPWPREALFTGDVVDRARAGPRASSGRAGGRPGAGGRSRPRSAPTRRCRSGTRSTSGTWPRRRSARPP